MRFELDTEVNALYIYFREIPAGAVAHTIELDDNDSGAGINLDVDAEGRVLGLEFVDADDFHRYLATHGGVLDIPEQVEDMLRGVPAPGARLESSLAEELRDRYVSFAKDFYGSTLDQAKGQLENDRSELEGLLEQLPEDQEEARSHIQELLDSFDSIVSVLDEAAQQGQPEITSAAAQRAQELGVDLSQIEGTGANSTITTKDVMGA